jgi:hypothetical protein
MPDGKDLPGLEQTGCFLLAATVMDTKCGLSAAEQLLRERDGPGASVALKEVMKRSVRLAKLLPEGAVEARKLRDEAGKISKIVQMSQKGPWAESRISVHLAHLYTHLQRIYDLAKRRCRVPQRLEPKL